MTAARMLHVAASCALLLATARCGSFRTIVGDPDEYAQFRAFRLADTERERVDVSVAYLAAERAAHHDADHFAEIDRWFRAYEERLYARALASRAEAELYLARMPDSPRHEAVRRSLAARDREERARPLREARAKERAARIARKLAASHGSVTDAVADRVARATKVADWSRDAVGAIAVDPAFLSLFVDAHAPGLALACDAFACFATREIRWSLDADFALDRDGDEAEDHDADASVPADGHSLALAVRVLRTRSGIGAVEISLGRDGFLRWLASSEGHASTRPAALAREDALGFAKNRVESWLTADRVCAPIDGPGHRAIVCDDVTALVTEGASPEEPGGEDLVSVFPSAPRPSARAR